MVKGIDSSMANYCAMAVSNMAGSYVPIVIRLSLILLFAKFAKGLASLAAEFDGCNEQLRTQRHK